MAELLRSNEELIEALRIYDDIERIGVEREIERAARERSRVETRHTPSVSATFQSLSMFVYLALT